MRRLGSFRIKPGSRLLLRTAGLRFLGRFCGFLRFCCFKIFHVFSFFVVFILFWFFISWWCTCSLTTLWMWLWFQFFFSFTLSIIVPLSRTLFGGRKKYEKKAKKKKEKKEEEFECYFWLHWVGIRMKSSRTSFCWHTSLGVSYLLRMI